MCEWMRWDQMFYPTSCLKPVSPKSGFLSELSGMSLFKGIFSFFTSVYQHWVCFSLSTTKGFELPHRWWCLNTYTDVHTHTHTLDSGVSQTKRMCVCVFEVIVKVKKAFFGECMPAVWNIWQENLPAPFIFFFSGDMCIVMPLLSCYDVMINPLSASLPTE